MQETAASFETRPFPLSSTLLSFPTTGIHVGGIEFPQYRGRLTFHGGLSTQQTLPFGTLAEVRAEARKLISLGRDGGYILSPAHAVEGDVPLENMLAFIDEALSQPGFKQ